MGSHIVTIGIIFDIMLPQTIDPYIIKHWSLMINNAII